jgi:5-methyltetrahydropteroyltriglutamate--homocysteine methyltransferase
MTGRVASPPPFRAEHVGSLLRPESLRAAHRAFSNGEIDAAAFRAAQDAAVAAAVRLQESLGYRAVTDGEFRRISYWGHFLDAIDGLALGEARFAFRKEAGERIPFICPHVAGPLRRKRGISTEEFGFLRGIAHAVPKITMPSPATFHFWHGGNRDWFADMAKIFQDELSALARMGCRYVQLDDVPFAMLCDPAIRERVKKPNRLTDEYIELTNACIAARPADICVALHVCRGNFKGAFLSEGGYDEVAERVFGGLAVDAYFLEYDTPRAGDFGPLRHVPRDASVVLGLVSSKTGGLEDRAALIGRIVDAAKTVPLERLGISPQCGFASAVSGNPVTEADQTAKLRLVAETAQEVWGGT